tara:strand:- start:370 stop:972 length:603 start_codon:yes stop_codon:yes gene_type:complete
MVNIVTLEGIDYSGKTTTFLNLAKRKKTCHFNEGVVYPTGLTARLLAISNQSTNVEREFLYTMMMMMDKKEANVRDTDDEKLVIQDRYWPSVVCYGRFLNGKNSMHYDEDHSSLFIQPKATVLLSCSNNDIQRRSEKRGRMSTIDKILLSSPDKIKKLRMEIERSVENLPNVLRIDTTEKPTEVIGEEIINYIETLGLIS